MINKVIVKKLAGQQTIIKESRQIPEDPFRSMYGNEVIEPLYDPELLIRLPEISDILQQCIDAYKTNIVGFGINYKYDIDYDKEKDTEIKKQLDIEWEIYSNFFKFCNFDEAFAEIMKKVIEDKEKIGWGAIEIIPDGLNRPAGIEHIPGQKLRICKTDRKLIDVKVPIEDETGRELTIIRKKRFKKFVQIQGNKKVYFKEFGDPRQLNYESGEYAKDGESIPEDKQATSIIFFNIYCPYTEYGLPRYIGQLLNINGNRKAEELNYTYFEEGRHMPLAIVVENGQLTEESINSLQSNKGDNARYKYLVLEAEGFEDDDSIDFDGNKKSNVSIKFEKLAEILNDDALFQNYCKNNRDKIRSSFRLHPIYTGESQDYNRATADTARQITEEQVFQPEREAIAFTLNNLLKPQLGIKNTSMYFKSPKITDNTEKAKALVPYTQAGTATPNMLLEALGELLGKEFEPYKEEWGNKPLQIALKELELQSKQQTQSQELVEKSDSKLEILEALKTIQTLVEGALLYEE